VVPIHNTGGRGLPRDGVMDSDATLEAYKSTRTYLPPFKEQLTG
jgi:hypothetical protein